MRITYKTKRLLSLIKSINMAKHHLENGDMDQLNKTIIRYQELLRFYFDIYKYNYVNIDFYEKLHINIHIYFISLNSEPFLQKNKNLSTTKDQSNKKFEAIMRSINILIEATYFFGFSHWLTTKNALRVASSTQANISYVSIFKTEIENKSWFTTCRAEGYYGDQTVPKLSFFRQNPPYLYGDLLALMRSIKRGQASKLLHLLFQEATAPTKTEAFVTAMIEVVAPSSANLSLWELSDLRETLTRLSEAIFTFSQRVKGQIALEAAMTAEKQHIYPRTEAALEHAKNAIADADDAIFAIESRAPIAPSSPMDRCLKTAKDAFAEAKNAETRANLQWELALSSETLEALCSAGTQAEQEALYAIFTAEMVTRMLGEAQRTTPTILVSSSSSLFSLNTNMETSNTSDRTPHDTSVSFVSFNKKTI